MRLVSPKAVTERAVKDRKFFEALIRDPGKALVQANMRLAANDMRRLRRALRTRRAWVRLDPVGAIRHLRDCPRGWPAGWIVPW